MWLLLNVLPLCVPGTHCCGAQAPVYFAAWMELQHPWWGSPGLIE